MDLLFKRYASPFLLLDEMLACQRFLEFVTEFLKLHNEDMEAETLWDLWLHRVYDKSFDEFKMEIGYSSSNETQETIDAAVLETTVKESNNILNGFIPPK